MRVFDFLRQRLEDQAGISVNIWTCWADGKCQPKHTLQTLSKEWSPRFEELMKNRLTMGGLRYGLLNAFGKTSYDRIKGAQKRLKQYQATGNTECLVDVSNMMLLEFEEGNHPTKHFGAMEGDHCCV